MKTILFMMTAAAEMGLGLRSTHLSTTDVMEEQPLDLQPRSRRAEGLQAGRAVGAGSVVTSRVIFDCPQTRTELAALLRATVLASVGGIAEQGWRAGARVTATT